MVHTFSMTEETKQPRRSDENKDMSHALQHKDSISSTTVLSSEYSGCCVVVPREERCCDRECKGNHCSKQISCSGATRAQRPSVMGETNRTRVGKWGGTEGHGKESRRKSGVSRHSKGVSCSDAWWRPPSLAAALWGLALVLVPVGAGPGNSCPRECFCPAQGKMVHCPRTNLAYIPENMPIDTVELILTDNNFKNPILTRRNFTRLESLENLYLSGCGIESIALDTFVDVRNLRTLDLSRNRISFLPDFVFRGLTLRSLFLSDNPGMTLSERAFEGLRTDGLYMQRCAFVNLSLNALRPLNGSLLSLWIDENNIESFSSQWQEFFSSLKHLRLGQNPFHCNCELSWLFKFFNERKNVFAGIPEPPACSSPPFNLGKTFLDLQAQDFRCELPSFRDVSADVRPNISRLACEARGDPTPTLLWVHPDGTIETFYPKSEDSHENQGVVFVTSAALQDKAQYRCVASNPAGNVTFTLNLALPVERHTTTPPPRVSDTLVTTKGYRAGRGQGGQEDLTWTVNQAEMAHGQQGEGKAASFSIVDLIGAVVGTFLLTLIVCVLAFHLVYKRRERRRYEEEAERANKKNNLYIMPDGDENCIKMINHSNEHPS